MTEAEIIRLIGRLTPAQRRFLHAKVTGAWHHVDSRGGWKTLDALVAKKLLIGTWVTTTGGHRVLDYQPSTLVAQVAARLLGAAPRPPAGDDRDASAGA